MANRRRPRRKRTRLMATTLDAVRRTEKASRPHGPRGVPPRAAPRRRVPPCAIQSYPPVVKRQGRCLGGGPCDQGTEPASVHPTPAARPRGATTSLVGGVGRGYVRYLARIRDQVANAGSAARCRLPRPPTASRDRAARAIACHRVCHGVRTRGSDLSLPTSPPPLSTSPHSAGRRRHGVARMWVETQKGRPSGSTDHRRRTS